MPTEKKQYDLIIIGGGPAGLMAAVYAGRYKIDSLVISKTMGGTASTAHKICNHPGFIDIKGFDLMQKYLEQVKEQGISIIYDEVTDIKKIKNEFLVSVSDEELRCKKIIFCIGTERIRLNIPGEHKFLGKGVSYCSTCDASFFKNKATAVIGGSNAALTSALLLSEYCPKIYLIYKKARFTKPEPSWIELVEKNDKIQIIFNEELSEIKGEKSVEEIILKSGKILKVKGVFVEAGSIPNTELLSGLKIKTDENGFIITDKEQKTNIHGLFAAGDITNNSLKQIITASGEGATAAYSSYKEIKEEN